MEIRKDNFYMPSRNNKDANYFSTVGGYRGAYKKKGKWYGVQIWPRSPDLRPKVINRWQGPPSLAIVKAMKEAGTGIKFE